MLLRAGLNQRSGQGPVGGCIGSRLGTVGDESPGAANDWALAVSSRHSCFGVYKNGGMQVVVELDKRIQEARKLLALDELHLKRVRAAGLDDETAIDLVRRQQRYLARLLSHRQRVFERRVIFHQSKARRENDGFDQAGGW